MSHGPNARDSGIWTIWTDGMQKKSVCCFSVINMYVYWCIALCAMVVYVAIFPPCRLPLYLPAHRGSITWWCWQTLINNTHKAAAQKARSEQQAAAQASGKRNQIAFTSSSTRTSQASHSLHAPAKKDSKERRVTRKFEPYESGSHKTRPGTRWWHTWSRFAAPS